MRTCRSVYGEQNWTISIKTMLHVFVFIYFNDIFKSGLDKQNEQ